MTNKELTDILRWLDVGDKAEKHTRWTMPIQSKQMRIIVKELLTRRLRTAKKPSKSDL